MTDMLSALIFLGILVNPARFQTRRAADTAVATTHREPAATPNAAGAAHKIWANHMPAPRRITNCEQLGGGHAPRHEAFVCTVYLLGAGTSCVRPCSRLAVPHARRGGARNQ